MTARRRSRSLTQDEVVEMALRIVDEEGLDGLTMRRLGSALEVEAMALYRHVPNKEALLDLTLDRMRSELTLDVPLTGAAEMLEAVFVAYWRVLMAHPNMLPLAMRRTDQDGTSGLEFMLDQGMDPDEAVALYQSLMALTLGYAVVATQDGAWSGLPDGLKDRMDRWEEATLRRSIRQLLDGYELDEKGGRR